TQPDGAPGVAGCRRERREVAGHHRRCRNIRDGVPRVLAGRRTLKTSKEEKLVFDNRSAEGAAELIAFQAAIFDCKILAGVEQVVADEFKKVAVELIGAGLR